jgi:8-oxo-dGTP diphosphatase
MPCVTSAADLSKALCAVPPEPASGPGIITDMNAASAEYHFQLPRMQVASGCLLTDGAGHVLLVKPTYKPPWEIPGGAVEEGESPLAACLREVREELGIDVAPSSLLVVDYLEPQTGRRGDALRFVFDGGELSAGKVASIKLNDDELSEFRFVAPAVLEDYVTPVLARRLRACLAGTGVGYLEEGYPVLSG